MNELIKLPNIGKVLAEELTASGIDTDEKLKKTGSKKAWLKLKERDESSCLSKLCALEGAIQKTRWHKLDGEVKKELKEFFIKYNKK